ncbi:MAG: 50S ribosomal protein L29 [Kiritimatiellae bacterium]|nr:50S ribosomal protein L29 [Kiritimatiellia bacterium]
MKAKEIRNLAEGELDTRLAELQQELFNLRMQKGMGQTERPLRVREVRREIARVKTIQLERRAQAAVEA